MRTFGELVAEGAAVPTEGWDFSWFAGRPGGPVRATEERPPWGYARLMGERMARAEAALDVQTGGGEVTASIPKGPERLVVTESWRPNIAVARRNLAPLNAHVIEAADTADLPFAAESFDLVVSRHPTVTLWGEIARVLKPGGAYFSQQIGAGTNVELIEWMMGPHEVGESRSTDRARQEAERAGLTVTRIEEARLRAEYHDVGAVVHFLRKVLWTVPDFTVERYRDRLRALHEHIEREGPFVSHATRFLIEARKRQLP